MIEHLSGVVIGIITHQPSIEMIQELRSQENLSWEVQLGPREITPQDTHHLQQHHPLRGQLHRDIHHPQLHHRGQPPRDPLLRPLNRVGIPHPHRGMYRPSHQGEIDW